MPSANQKPTTADLLLKLHGDPVLFVQSVLGAEPQEWQREALEAVRDTPRVACKSGHGVGKSALLSWVILWYLITRSCRIVCTANSANQLNQVLWAEIQKWARQMPKGIQSQLEITSDKISVKGVDSSCHARVSRKENPEALQGFHHERLLFVIDECSGVDDVIFEVAQGALSTAGSKILMVGNPTRNAGYFYDAFNRNSHRWHKMTVSCADAEYVSEDFIEDMAQQYGEDSAIFSVRVKGEFAETSEDSLIPRHLIDSAIDRDVDPMLVAPIWGLDPARFGGDRTALAKRQGNVLIEPIKAWQGKDLMETVGIILAEWETTNFMDRPSEICVDSIGVGAGVVDRLRELGMPARGVNVAESPALGNRYQRLRDELWFKCREWFEARDCQIPDQDELLHELTSLRFKILSSGKFKAEGKDEMKKRGLRSPDLADSLVLTFGSQAVRAAGSVDSYGYNADLDYGKSSWIV